MDSSMETLSPMQMIEEIAKLRHRQSQLSELNKEMKHWLDVADEEILELRSQKTSMTKHIKSLEKLLVEKANNEAETSGLLQGDDLDAENINAEKMNKMEKEAALMMEENQKLTVELRSLHEEKEKDHANMRNLTTDLETFKRYLEEVELELQEKDEIIHQKTLQLSNFEETVGEYINITEDLRLTNQELKRPFEEALERTSVAALNEPAAENEGALSRPLSIAQEIQLQAKEAALMEENQKLTAELKRLQKENEKNQVNLIHLKTELQMSKELLLTNQEQRRQLEEALERTPQPTAQEETEHKDQTNPTVVHQLSQCDDQSSANEKKKESSSGWSWTFCLMCVLICFLTLVVFVAPGRSYQLCPLLSDLLKVLQPHVSLTHRSRPPI